MKRNTLLLISFCLFAQLTMAQAPKWLDKAKRAVFSVVTYDKDNNIINSGNGFFVTESGVALSDYASFKGAERAVVIDCDGQKMEVETILGANSMYDVIKFQVNTNNKKVTTLGIASTAPAQGSDIYLLPYSTQKDKSFTAGKVTEVSSIGEQANYYTLSLALGDKQVSCPVLNAAGEVFGVAQKATGKDAATQCYAVGVKYGMSLSISPLSVSDITYKSIGIKKGLPTAEDEALVNLFMASGQVSPEEYTRLLDEFIGQFPNSVDGYIRRATNYVYTSTDESGIQKAANDLSKALSVATKKDEVHYNAAKLIYTYQLTGPENKYKDWTMDKALAEIRSALAIDPQPIYTLQEGDILFAQQDYAGALAAYEKVNQSNMASSQSFFSAAKTKELLGADIKEVIALMDSCILRIPLPISATDGAYFLERANTYMQTEQYRPAMLDYDTYYRAVRGNVNDVFYYYREQAAFHARQFQRALDDINMAIKLNPEEPTYHTELGVINLRVGRYEEAEKSFNKTISLVPDYAEAYRLKGVALQQLKKIDEACENFKKAKELGDTVVDSFIEKTCK
ncbi:tetratricopeptide repeat protein [Bacteroides sp. 519]|uniref:tetratricopeptide repeat protein n=1 Tax=Bacteroides sp. 519 TaxID=2302937 RepID=UPI0013D2DE85|nr:tetratricopeptide repeat protein [Bacteroides sp. 519]NDV58357.1 serine protease [Bacteroides sp. 519]